MTVVLVLWRHTNSLKLPGSSHTEHPQQVESLVKIVFHGGKSVALHWPTTNIASHTSRHSSSHEQRIELPQTQ